MAKLLFLYDIYYFISYLRDLEDDRELENI